MIGRWETRLRRLRRWASRSEWAIWLLGLPKSRGTANARGLVLVQIDGLSRHQFQQALARGRMPFLRRLLAREHYHLHTFYSGLPSSTPAVQGELFYGQRCAVPAFSFRDPVSLEVVQMFDQEPARRVEERLAKLGTPLLRGGSAYCDIYTGGADEPHFCAPMYGWGGVTDAVNPLKLLTVILLHFMSFVRMALLAAVELALALVDGVRGMFGRNDIRSEFRQESKMVLSRVVVSLLLREMVAIGAVLDVTRGVPVVHLNLLGYDEQAHRRGPGSAFARWSLKGIDGAICRIWHAARNSPRREYDVWVFSDHGQEQTTPYAHSNGRSIDAAVADVFHGSAAIDAAGKLAQREHDTRASWLGGGRLARKLLRQKVAVAESRGNDDEVSVVAMGPVGLVYCTRPMDEAQRRSFARRLVDEAKIPLVLVASGSHGVTALNEAGEFELPGQAAEVFGGAHPFLEEVAADLVTLCRHAAAGTFVISGFRRGGPMMTFPIEHGSHAGPGPEETRAFALVPSDAPLPDRRRDYLRPLDLRAAAMEFLDGDARAVPANVRRTPAPRRTLRVMTYNVHSCLGMDGKLSIERVARVIAHSDADVVALQELDVGRARTNGVDQAHAIARALEMEFHFHAAIKVKEERYGDAVLSRFPLRLIHSGPLPTTGRGRLAEPRGAIWVELLVGRNRLQLINTHLGLAGSDRKAQVNALLSDRWLGHPDCRDPLVVCGDFNATPRSRTYARLSERVRDAQCELNGHRPLATWFSRRPMGRIDHVFVGEGISIESICVPRSHLACVASDHLPLVVDLTLNVTGSEQTADDRRVP